MVLIKLLLQSPTAAETSPAVSDRKTVCSISHQSEGKGWFAWELFVFWIWPLSRHWCFSNFNFTGLFHFSYFLSHQLIFFLFLSSHGFQNWINKENVWSGDKTQHLTVILANADATIAADKLLYYITVYVILPATKVSFAYRASYHCITSNLILSMCIYMVYFLAE